MAVGRGFAGAHHALGDFTKAAHARRKWLSSDRLGRMTPRISSPGPLLTFLWPHMQNWYLYDRMGPEVA